MKLRKFILSLSQVLLVLLLMLEHTGGEQTVFVLETSDSDSLVSGSGSGDPASSKGSAQDEVGNTEIITDESALNPKRASSVNSTARPTRDQIEPKHNTNNQRHQPTTIRPSNSTEADSKYVPEHKHQVVHEPDQKIQSVNQTSSNLQDVAQNDDAAANRHRDNSASRRSLDNESNLTATRDKPPHHQPGHHPPPPAHHDHPPPHHHDHPPPHHHDHPPHHNEQRESHPSQPQPQPKLKAGSVTTPSSDTPKTEERLLISITSDEDDSYNPRPPKVSSSGQSSGYNEEPSSSPTSHHPKRKPGFTISIENPGGLNKQIGSTGQAVILRPTEEGLVIVPFGGSANSNNNKKPSGGGILGGLVGAISDSINQSHQSNNNNNDPYREPVNQPVRPTSTTRSPQISDSYSNNNNNNQPLTSTLLGVRPPSNQGPWTDERPQKPTYDDQSSPEPTRRPTSRPPFQDTSSSSSNLQQGDYENSNINNNGNEQPLGPKYPLNEKNCGIMHETRIVGGEEADPDDFMWMAAIIKSKPRDGEPRPFCGGSLITRRHILTAAHCLEGLAPRDVLVRLGGYDFEDTASSSSADFAIDQFRVPAQYSKKTHVADIAIMRLKTPLSPTDNYRTVCMPQPRRSYVGALGTVTGYGSQSQTFRRAAPKLRQVTVPIWENRKCSVVYKKNLTESFMCAGYEEGGKDACQGDSGGPLMTEGPEQKMMIVGVVSHGIGCGAPGYPGVYTRTSTFTDWIEKNTRE